jgi:hypothetical protein
MRLRLVMALIGTVMAVTGVSAQADVSGRWTVTFNTDQGSNSATMTLQQEGEALSGSVAGDQGTVEFDGGTVSGNKLAWVIEIDAGGQFFEIAMDGTVDGDTMAGTADFGGQVGGDWATKRAQ